MPTISEEELEDVFRKLNSRGTMNKGAALLPARRAIDPLKFYRLEDVANDLDVPAKWLNNWLLRNRCDGEGVGFYRKIGRIKHFTRDDLYRIRETMKKNIVERPLGEEGVVYFVASGDFIKIGFSRSMQRRMQKFHTESPLPAVLLHFELGTFKTEKTLHLRFSHLREKGEWFRQEQDLLDYIDGRRRLFLGQQNE